MTDTARTETLAQALAYVDDQPQSVHLYRPMAEYGLRRLDAYNAAHPPPPRYPPDWRDEIEADLRERIAAEIEAKGHPHGFHREGWSQEDAGAFCSNCEITARDARIVRGGA